MKELSIEEKARRYDEAIKVAVAAHKDEDKHLKATLERIFSELKESEDEKMRAMAIKAVHAPEAQSCIKSWGINPDDVIAWLEKQGEHTNFINNIQIGDKVTRNEDGVLVNLSQLNRVAKKDEKQGEQKPCMIQWKGDNLKEVIGFTGKDKNFDKWFKSFEEYEKYVHEHNDIFKLFNEDGSHYEVPIGAWIVKTPDGRNVASKSVFKQKVTDKVEPKFKIGDWITNGYYTWKIVEVKHLDYILQSQDGNIVDDTISYVDEHFHLWTIKDAKDGDVLEGDKRDVILMFRGIGNTEWDDDIDYHCYYDCYYKDYIVQEDVKYWGNTKNNQLKPATKEQCDLLFQKMKEAGYEWDADKKGLKKIEQNPANWLQELEDKLANATPKQLAEWKEKYFKEEAAEWSEEDERNLQGIIDEIEANKNAAPDYDLTTYDRFLSWLKSLKDRVQPQSQWKPSDEQMKGE